MTLDDLKRFCDPSNPRPHAQNPFSQGGWTFAGDDQLLVRTAPIAGVCTLFTPDCCKLFESKYLPGDWLPVPACSAPDKIQCPACDGEGFITCNIGHEHDCPLCLAEGVVEDNARMEVGGFEFYQRHLALLQGWEISIRGEIGGWISSPAALRRGDDIGLLMPLLPRHRGGPR